MDSQTPKSITITVTSEWSDEIAIPDGKDIVFDFDSKHTLAYKISNRTGSHTLAGVPSLTKRVSRKDDFNNIVPAHLRLKSHLGNDFDVTFAFVDSI